jgi:hypothetical protein
MKNALKTFFVTVVVFFVCMSLHQMGHQKGFREGTEFGMEVGKKREAIQCNIKYKELQRAN